MENGGAHVYYLPRMAVKVLQNTLGVVKPKTLREAEKIDHLVTGRHQCVSKISWLYGDPVYIGMCNS